MERIYIEYIGLAAGTLTTAAYLPQVWKTWRTKAVEHISLVMYTSMSLGVLLWLVYGVLIKAPAVIVANGLCLALVVGMLRMKIVYGRRARAAAADAKAASGQASSNQSSSNQSSSGQSSSGQTSSGQTLGPSLAARLGRSLRQLKPYASRLQGQHRKPWGKD